MANKIQKEIDELLQAGIINEPTAEKILTYYQSQKKSSSVVLQIVFGILGSILVGLGLFLVFSHNWDQLPRVVKICISFFPLICAQLLVAYSIKYKPESTVWLESSSTFLVFALGACMALMGQIYHLDTSETIFFLSWSLAILPLVYLVPSTMAALLYLTGIILYACNFSASEIDAITKLSFWLLLFLIFPFWLKANQSIPVKSSISRINILSVIAICIFWYNCFVGVNTFSFITSILLFGILFFIGEEESLANQKWYQNIFTPVGILGTIFVLIIMSFHGFWESLQYKNTISELWKHEDTFVITVIGLAICLIFSYRQRSKLFQKRPNPIYFIYLVTFPLIFLCQWNPYVTMWICNGLLVWIGIYFIRQGIQQDHILILNLGLITLCIVIACRFFDTELSFILRGIVFIIIGLSLFLINFLFLKRRKQINAQ